MFCVGLQRVRGYTFLDAGGSLGNHGKFTTGDRPFNCVHSLTGLGLVVLLECQKRYASNLPHPRRQNQVQRYSTIME